MHILPGAIRKARNDAGLTMEELAAKAGIALATLFGLESGGNLNPRVGTVDKIARALNVDGRLFFGCDYQKTDKTG